jgi:hypothetical protein
MIRYTLPDFSVGLGRNLFFIQLFDTHPEFFQEGVRIDSVYGCFPSCVANGGRAFVRERYTRAQMEETFSRLAAYGVTIRLTLTNMLLRPQDLEDEYLQTMLAVARNYDTQVIVYSDVISDHIREHFGFKQVLSTTREIDDLATLNAATERYDYVVLNYNRNKDRAFIKDIHDKDRIEVMVNEFCSYQCPHRAQHYLHNSEDQLAQTIRPFKACDLSENEFIKHEPGHPVLFTADEVRALHDECGIEYYKIVGRGVPQATIIEAYLHYLIKPTYQSAVKHLLLQGYRA